MLTQPVLAGSANVDTVYGPRQDHAGRLQPRPAARRRPDGESEDSAGETVDVTRVAGLALGGGCSACASSRSAALPRDAKYVVVEDVVTAPDGR